MRLFQKHYYGSLTVVTTCRRTIISDTLTNLIKILDEVEGIFWKTEFDTSNPDFYVLKVIDIHSAFFPSQLGRKLRMLTNQMKYRPCNSVARRIWKRERTRRL